MAKKILLIEDDREIATAFEVALKASGYDVKWAPNGLEGRRLVDEVDYDVVITDMMMPKMGGFPLLEHLVTLDRRPKTIMITANPGTRHKRYAQELLGVDEYLEKPVHPEVIIDTVERLLGESSDSE